MEMEEKVIDQEALKKKKGCLITLIVAAVMCVLFFAAAAKMLVPVDKHRFSAEEIAEIEAEYNMDLSGIKLERYRHITAQDHISEITFHVDSPEGLIEERFRGEISSKKEDGGTMVYKCENTYHEQKTELIVTISPEEDGSWKCFIVHVRYW